MNALFAWLALSAPVLSNYVFYGAVSIGDLFVILLIPLLAARFNKTPYNIANLLVGFLIIVACFYLLRSNFDTGFLRISFYLIIFLLVTSIKITKFDPDKFFGVYVQFCKFFSISLILQWLVYKLTGVAFSLQLPLPYYEPDTLKIISHVFRSGGWFKEPSYLVIFLLPAVILLLEKRRFISFSIIVFAGIISTSSLIAFVVVLSVFRFAIVNRLYTPVLLALIFGAAVSILALPALDEWIFAARLLDIFLDGGTLNERALPIIEVLKLSTNLGPNTSAYSLVTSSGDSGTVWYSSAAYLIASFGLSGFLFLVTNFSRFGLFLSVVFFTLTLTTHVFSGPYSFFSAIAFLCIKLLSIKRFDRR